MKNKTQELDLIKASGDGDIEKIKKLLEKGVDPNVQDLPGNTPLIAASKNGHVKVVRELLSFGTNVESQNITGSTALARASRNGHTEVVGILSACTNINTQNKKGFTPLMWASIMGHDEVVDELLRANPDTDIKNDNGDTALILASRSGRTKTIKKLIKFGADASIHNKRGNTAFHESSNKEVQQIFRQYAQDNFIYSNTNAEPNSYRKIKIAASIAAIGLVTVFQLSNQKTSDDLVEHIKLNINCISHIKKRIEDKSYRFPANVCEDAMEEILK